LDNVARRMHRIGGMELNMQYSQLSGIKFATLLGVGMMITTACGSVDDSRGDDATDSVVGDAQSDALRRSRWHRPPPSDTAGSSATGGTGSTAGSSSTNGGTISSPPTSTAECSVCAVTQECCNSVNAGSLCTFSADTCDSLDPVRQTAYARNCLMVLRTTISAWTMNRRAAPSACFMP
jgi:hypothetical protein